MRTSTQLPRLAGALVAVGAGALVLTITTPARAAVPTAHVIQVNQVADQAGMALVTDAALVNPWGLALGPTGPLWVANNGTNTATVYAGGLVGAPVSKVPLTVTIPGGPPTGQVFNDSTDFRVTVGAASAPATFLLVSESGDVTAWSAPISGSQATIVAHVTGANYKGATILHGAINGLLAADFRHGRIDVFDTHFHRLVLPAATFVDHGLPAGYAPFNVFADRDLVYVAYAKQNPAKDDAVVGAGLGLIDEYNSAGLLRRRLASHGTLNAPWGMAIAPGRFGFFGGALMVGNFGDGRIGAFRDGQLLGALRDGANRRVQIPGLWALVPGTATTGAGGTLWFSAGPAGESHGLVGQLVTIR